VVQEGREEKGKGAKSSATERGRAHRKWCVHRGGRALRPAPPPHPPSLRVGGEVEDHHAEFQSHSRRSTSVAAAGAREREDQMGEDGTLDVCFCKY